jgi:hypothetical protein
VLASLEGGAHTGDDLGLWRLDTEHVNDLEGFDLGSEGAQEGCTAHALWEWNLVGANLWPEDNTAALPLWRSGGTLSCATGPLLLPWLAATTSNGTTLLGRVRTRASACELRDNGLVDECLVHWRREGGRQLNGSHLGPSFREDVNSSH